MTTDLTKTAGTELVEFNVADPEELAMLADELDGIDGVAFERVKIPSGGGTTWEIPGDDPDNPETSREIVGVIVDDHPAAALWLDEDDEQPAAYSLDGKTQILAEGTVERCQQAGLPIPAADLASCPYNQFGTMHLIGKEGKGKATKNVWRLYVMREGAFLPILVSLPPTSLKGFKAFKVNRVVGKKLRLCDVVTKLTLRKEGEGKSAYSIVQFAIVGVLSEEQRAAMTKAREGIRPMTRRVEIAPADYDVAEPISSVPSEPSELDKAFAAAPSGAGAPADDEIPF